MSKKYKGVYYDEKTKTYYIKPRIKNIDGSEKRPTIRGFNGPKEAFEKLQEYLVEKKEKPDSIDITLNDLKNKYLSYLKGKIDDDTLKAKKTKLNHFCEIDKTNQVQTFPNKKVKYYDKSIYEIWQSEMKKKTYKSGKENKLFTILYLNEVHNEICRMIDYGITEGYCKLNFARQAGKIGTPKEIKMSKVKASYNTITFEEFSDLLKASEDNLKYNTYFDLSFSRGPRIGEIRAFKIKDYNPIKKQLMVNHTMSKNNILKEPKTAASKAPIDLDDQLNDKIGKLIQYWQQFSDFTENWYLFNGPTPISSNALENAKNRYFKKANIQKHIRPHDFRHSCATWLYSIGTPISVISKILRHANIGETMKTYTHLFNKDYTEELERINKLKIGVKKGSNKDI